MFFFNEYTLYNMIPDCKDDLSLCVDPFTFKDIKNAFKKFYSWIINKKSIIISKFKNI